MARKQGSHADITGPRIQDAALRLFAQSGYAAVSMRQIAAEVGVQVGALYNYTPDKQSLLLDLLENHMTQLLAAIDGQTFQGAPIERLETLTRFHISFHLPRRDAVFLSYMELRNLTPENFTKIEALRRTYEDAFEQTLIDGVADGSFAIADTRITTLSIIAQLTGITNWYKDGGRLDAPAIAEIYWDLVRKSVSP